MARKLVIVLLLSIAWLAGSCARKSDEASKESKEQTQEAKPAQQHQGQPVQAIGEGSLSEFDKLANGYIRPYFDAEGTQTEKTVKRGETFDLWVIAEYNKDIITNAAEYRLVVPDGMHVLSSANTDSIRLALGDTEDFTIAFGCTPGPKLWLVRYTCASDSAIQGGEIRTEAGARMHFLGFTLCDANASMVNARPGKASITVE